MAVVIQIPTLPVTEVLLTIIAIQLFRLASRVAEALPLLRRIAADTGDGEAKSLAAATDGRPEELSKRLLSGSSKKFAAALLGDDDVDVALFMKACRDYTVVLGSLGPFTMIACREVHSNMAKVEHTYALAPDRFTSMRMLLEEEVRSQMHSAETGLADPSAAMGLLWARRGLRYWQSVFGSVLEGRSGLNESAWIGSAGDEGARSGGVASGYRDAMAAYEETIGPFNGWVTRNMFTVAARATPDWSATGPKLAPSLKDLQEDMAEWTTAVANVLDRMAGMHRQLDLEDLRKSL